MPTTYPASKGDWSSTEGGDKTLIDRIRKRYDYMTSAWREIHDQGALDQRALSLKGCWTDEELEARKEKRPCIHLDQLTQHIAALVNNVRSNPIAIKIEPAGEGSNEDTADIRSRRIRAIEYESNAQQSYQAAFESAASIGFGVFGVTIEYKSWDSMDRIIRIRRFANAMSVLWDPDCMEADWSDMKDAFVLFRMDKEDFEREYGKAEQSSFGESYVRISPEWSSDDSIQIAEYWYVEKKKRRMFHLEEQQGVKRYFSDELMKGKWSVKGDVFTFGDGTTAKVLDDRETEEPSVRRCVTNGVQILDTYDWPGKEIPIIPVIGKERYVRVGNQVKRELDSYIRMARDGQKLFDYYASNEAEIIGMSPKIPWIGYKGQFSEDYWENLHKEPRAFAEIEPIVDPVGNQVLPLPQRNTYEPPVQALEVGKESTRRSIQSAVASYGFTRLDDTNVKSGVALERLQASNDLGSYHFIDNYKIAIRRAARIVNDLLDDVEPGEREVSLRNLDDTQEVMTVNTEDPKTRYRLSDESQHEVTIATGPSYESQRGETVDFLKNFIQNIGKLPVEPAAAQKILARFIGLMEFGPLGDQIVEILDPKEGEGSPEQMLQQMQGALQQLQQQNQALNEYAKIAEGKIKELLDEKQANREKLDSAEAIAALKASVDKLKIQADLLKTHEQLSSDENIAVMENKTEREMQRAQHEIDVLASREKNATDIEKSKQKTQSSDKKST